MATTTVNKIQLRIQNKRTQGFDQGSRVLTSNLESDLTWANGSGTSEADEVWTDNITLGIGLFNNLDLNALAQTDALGAADRTVDFVNIKAMMIRNTSAADYILVGGGTDCAGAADAWSGVDTPFSTDAAITTVPAGGVFTWVAPIGGAVAAGEILGIGAVTSIQTFQILLIGDK